LPLKATGGHISVIGHITLDELRARLTRTDAASGFANRFLFVCVRRSKLLPFGGNLPDDKIQKLAHSIKNAADFARRIERVTMTEAAREAWRAVYEELSAEHPGLLGA